MAGEYRVRVRYHGPAEGVLQKLRKTWPEKPLGGVWTGDVSSAEATFQIAEEPEGKRPELVWGEPVKGLPRQSSSAAATTRRNRGSTTVAVSSLMGAACRFISTSGTSASRRSRSGPKPGAGRRRDAR